MACLPTCFTLKLLRKPGRAICLPTAERAGAFSNVLTVLWRRCKKYEPSPLPEVARSEDDIGVGKELSSQAAVESLRASGVAGEGNGSADTTHVGPMRTRTDVGAEVNGNNLSLSPNMGNDYYCGGERVVIRFGLTLLHILAF